MITNNLIDEIKNQFHINWNGVHGISHWARVYDIGMKLTEHSGANKRVVQLFSLFHDSRRLNENLDPQHGPRGAELARQLRETYLSSLKEEELELLHTACSHHTDASSHEDITVQTCFDADRLDLARVGIIPDPKYLCTNAAKTSEIISWAIKKSINGEVPDNVLGRLII